MTASSPTDDDILSNKQYQDAKGHEYKRIVIQSGFEDITSLDAQLEGMFSRDQSGIFSCHHCPKIFKRRDHMQEHVESHVEGLQFACNFCSKPLRTRASLRMHMQKHKD